jgi:hypothetical protein
MNNTERQSKIEKFGKAYDELSSFLKKLSKEVIAYKPAPGKWSAHEIVIHIADAEANSYTRLHKALAEPGGMIFAYDQDAWADNLDYSHRNFDDHLELFRLLRKTCYDLIKNMPSEKWDNQYNHSEYGLVGLDRWLDIYVKHIPGHVAQIERNLAHMKEAVVK